STAWTPKASRGAAVISGSPGLALDHPESLRLSRANPPGSGVGKEAATLGFGQAAPDAVRLVHAQRELEALLSHDALRADRLRLRLARFSHVPPFGDRRRKEQRRLGASARGPEMP